MAMFCRRTIESRIPYLISKLELIRLSRRAEKKGELRFSFEMDHRGSWCNTPDQE